MKKLLFILSFFVAFSAFAAPPRGGKLTIYSHDKSAIRVIIDGKRYPLEYNMLVLNDVEPGNHTIKIVERLTSTYNVAANREKVLYNGSVYVRSNYHVDIIINRFGKTLVDEQEVSSNEDDDYNNEGGYNYGTAISDVDFESLKRSLQQEKFTSNRMTKAKTAISSNYFKTEQVKQMAQLFSFEDDKMQLVKQAYPKTVDRSTYYQLSDLFSFSTNKDELARFIQENGGQYDNGNTSRTVISDIEFNRLKSKVQSSFSESAKLAAARQAIDGSYFTASQVKDIVLLFAYDSGRLDIAKYAYGRTVNQADYILYLGDVFASRTSKDELSRYIANYR
jgi:hypothetical protein